MQAQNQMSHIEPPKTGTCPQFPPHKTNYFALVIIRNLCLPNPTLQVPTIISSSSSSFSSFKIEPPSHINQFYKAGLDRSGRQVRHPRKGQTWI